MFSFVETKLFTRLVQEYLSDDEYAQVQQALIADPEVGAVIPGSGGVRKMRWRVAGRGKRGGLRVIYFLRTRPDLDADPLRQERGREHTGSRSQTDQG
jgi:hypothetical protein